MSMAESLFLSEALLLAVMGVAGSGKSSVARILADRLRSPLREGHDLHTQGNIAKMCAGWPLNDADRRPWLARIADGLAEARNSGGDAVASCSALKRAYPDRLRRAGPGLVFVYMAAHQHVLTKRLNNRVGHFMAPGLIDSQFSARERPSGEHGVVELAVAAPIEGIGDQVERTIAGRMR